MIIPNYVQKFDENTSEGKIIEKMSVYIGALNILLIVISLRDPDISYFLRNDETIEIYHDDAKCMELTMEFSDDVKKIMADTHIRTDIYDARSIMITYIPHSVFETNIKVNDTSMVE